MRRSAGRRAFLLATELSEVHACMNKQINGTLRNDIVEALQKSIRGQEALEAARRLVAAVDSGQVMIADAELYAPPTVAGERFFTFKFHLRAVG